MGATHTKRMSALGQKQTFTHCQPTSALPQKADIAESDWHVRFVPKADMKSFDDLVGERSRAGPLAMPSLRSIPMCRNGVSHNLERMRTALSVRRVASHRQHVNGFLIRFAL